MGEGFLVVLVIAAPIQGGSIIFTLMELKLQVNIYSQSYTNIQELLAKKQYLPVKD